MRRPLILALLLVGTGCAAPLPVPPLPASPSPYSSASAPPPATPGPPAKPSPAPVTGLLVPLYEPPTKPGWAELVALKRRHPALPVIAIVNPDNGPSWGPDPAFTAGIAALQGAGVQVLGYLSTRYGKRDPAKVAADGARWKRYAPGLQGIFLDELATDAHYAPFYVEIVAQAHAAGFALTVGNAGTTPDLAIAALVDVVVAYERPGLPGVAPGGLARERLAALAYDVAALDGPQVRAAATGFGWLYVTEGPAQNPWASLSRYAEPIAGWLESPPRLGPSGLH